MTIHKEAGIYKLTCSITDKVYIGKSVNIKNRLYAHKHCHKKSRGESYLRNAIMKYGWESFSIEILETVENFDKLKDNDKLLERESYYIELFDSTDGDKGYNLCKFSNDRTGIPLTEETKRKMSLSRTGQKRSDETKIKMSLSSKGKAKSDAHKESLRQSNLGKKLSDETKDKIRESILGRKHSEESKERMRKPKPVRM